MLYYIIVSVIEIYYIIGHTFISSRCNYYNTTSFSNVNRGIGEPR